MVSHTVIIILISLACLLAASIPVKKSFFAFFDISIRYCDGFVVNSNNISLHHIGR